MFSRRQVALAGLLSPNTGCFALSVNFRELPYRRGAWIGLGFGALVQMMAFFVVLAVLSAFQSQFDESFASSFESFRVEFVAFAIIHVLSSVGCVIMASYFDTPPKRGMSWDRAKLLAKFRRRDSGKRSVLHDIVGCLEAHKKVSDRPTSIFFLILSAFFTFLANVLWYKTLSNELLDVLFFGIPIDFFWGAFLAAKMFLITGILLSLHAVLMKLISHCPERAV